MIYVLNAPPNAGKDTIADILVDKHGAIKASFKHALYKCTSYEFKMDLDKLIKLSTDRDTKEVYCNELGMSPREALIYTSEQVIKPKHGADYFGNQAAKSILANNIASELIVFSDGGFESEIAPLTKIATTTIVRLYGRGNFINDSRDYIVHPMFRYMDIELVDDMPDLAAMQIMKDVERSREYVSTGRIQQRR